MQSQNPQLAQLIDFLTSNGGKGSVPSLNSILLAKSTKLIDDMTSVANGDAITGGTAERVQMIYSAVACQHCNGETDQIDTLPEEVKAKLLGRALEIAVASLLGEAAKLYSSIVENTDGHFTPGPFPIAAATLLASGATSVG